MFTTLSPVATLESTVKTQNDGADSQQLNQFSRSESTNERFLSIYTKNYSFVSVQKILRRSRDLLLFFGA